MVPDLGEVYNDGEKELRVYHMAESIHAFDELPEDSDRKVLTGKSSSLYGIEKKFVRKCFSKMEEGEKGVGVYVPLFGPANESPGFTSAGFGFSGVLHKYKNE